jgi:RNA polymerase sigma factor (sigma-70 family)
MRKRKLQQILTKQEQHEIVVANIDLSAIIASKFRGYCDFDEMTSAGNLGLVEGAERYDPDKGAAPRSYLSRWVFAYIMKYIYENRSVHIPANKINQVIAQNRGVEFDVEFSIPPEVSFNKFSDEGDGGESDRHFSNRLEFEAVKLEGIFTEADELTEHVEHMIANASLSSIEEEAIIHRFGLRGKERKTLKEIASASGYTEMGIHKAEKRALQKLKLSEASEIFA